MKIFIAFSILFMVLSTVPTPILATIQSPLTINLRTDFRTNVRTETKPSRAKWERILEWAIPIFLILGIILYFSSLNLFAFVSMIVRPINYNLALISFGISALCALTYFFCRIPKIVRDLK